MEEPVTCTRCKTLEEQIVYLRLKLDDERRENKKLIRRFVFGRRGVTANPNTPKIPIKARISASDLRHRLEQHAVRKVIQDYEKDTGILPADNGNMGTESAVEE